MYLAYRDGDYKLIVGFSGNFDGYSAHIQQTIEKEKADGGQQQRTW